MPHVLEHRDLADQVFLWLSRHELTVTTLVSRAWFEASIAQIWKDVELKTVMSLLGAFETLDQDSYYRFKEVPNQEKWTRFLIYSSCVLSLKGKQRDRFALEMVVNSRPPTFPAHSIFPKCRYLSWQASSDDGLMDLSIFIGERLEHLVLQVHDLTHPFLSGISRGLSRASPDLRFLQLDITEPSNRTLGCQELVNQLLTSFGDSLRFIQIPQVFNTTDTLQRLHKLPNLYHLMINVGGLLLYNPRILTQTDGNYEGRGAFTSLQTLSFGGLQESLCDIFLKLSNLSSLQTLRWYLQEELQDAKSFIQTIVEGCPQLKVLDVGHSRMYHKPNCRRPEIPWCHLRPILQCKKLRVLMLHCFQVKMDPPDFMEFVSDRNTWTGVELFTARPLRMIDLFLFAKHFPNLKNLGVFVDGFLGLPSRCEEYSGLALPPLTSVEFAFSSFPEEMAQSVASFFFQFCKEPPYLGGWDLTFWDNVSINLAELYIQKEEERGIPMSTYTREFIDQAMKVKNAIEDADMELYGEEVDSEWSEDEEAMAIDDDMTVMN